MQAAGQPEVGGVLQRERRRRGRPRASRRAPDRSIRCGGTTSPARTPIFTPGVHIRPSASRRRGSTSHSSPRSSSVSARSNLSAAGFTSGPIIVARSVAGPTRTLRTASARRVRKRGVVVERGFDDREARGRALLAGVAERRADEIAERKIEVGAAGDDERVLAARLRDQAQLRLPRRGTVARFRTRR